MYILYIYIYIYIYTYVHTYIARLPHGAHGAADVQAVGDLGAQALALARLPRHPPGNTLYFMFL